MVARLTPDQKAACSNHVGVSTDLFIPFYGGFTLLRDFYAHADISITGFACILK